MFECNCEKNIQLRLKTKIKNEQEYWRRKGSRCGRLGLRDRVLGAGAGAGTTLHGCKALYSKAEERFDRGSGSGDRGVGETAKLVIRNRIEYGRNKARGRG